MFSFYSVILDLIKARTHKYVRRIPVGTTNTGGTKYRYFYQGQEGHGKGIAHESELVVGASFVFGEGENKYHAHITKVDGNMITVKHDDGAKKGTEHVYTKEAFQKLVHHEHRKALEQAKQKASKQLADFQQMKELGAKVKQETLDKLEQRVKNLDASTGTPKKTNTKKVHVKSTPLALQPANKIMSFLRKVLKNGTQTGKEFNHVLVKGTGTFLVQTEKTAVLLSYPENMTLGFELRDEPVYLSDAYTKKIAEDKKCDKIEITRQLFTEESMKRDVYGLDAFFRNYEQIRTNRLGSSIIIDLTSTLKDKLQESINALGDNADNTKIDIMYPKDGKISIYFRNTQKEEEPILFDTVPYKGRWGKPVKLSENPQQQKLSISPSALSMFLPYASTWSMDSAFSSRLFIFEEENSSATTTIFHVTE